MTEKSSYQVIGIDLAIDGEIFREGETVALTEEEAKGLAAFVVPAPAQEPVAASTGIEADTGNESTDTETAAAEAATPKPAGKKGAAK